MELYSRQALAQGIIHLSTSRVSSGFFFVKKKDGGLWPYIHYQVLNVITKKH